MTGLLHLANPFDPLKKFVNPEKLIIETKEDSKRLVAITGVQHRNETNDDDGFRRSSSLNKREI